tara:strand:- start:250 stop:666 length:417 start_codon:yes stop_codon:yes gene_type:complete
MRPTYETSEDLLNERGVIESFCNRFGFGFEKMPKQYHLDYCVLKNNKVVGFCEVKVRTNNHNQYNTLLLSLSKVSAANGLKQASNINSILLVKWKDRSGYTYFKNNWPVMVGGRKDRNDWQDIEPVVHIPIPEFKFIG